MCLYPQIIFNKSLGKSVKVGCGHCVECLKRYSREWAFRILFESRDYPLNSFITLTYDNEHLPTDGRVKKRDFQLFIKRLRKKVGKVRYFGCGEYGSHRKRPHYHVIVFGWLPDDIQRLNKSGGTSKLLSDLWQNGFHLVTPFEFEHGKYCAKYLQKLNLPDDFMTEKNFIDDSFVLMSKKPPIGLFQLGFDDEHFISDKYYYKGEYISVPRVILKYLDKQGFKMEGFRERRRLADLQLSDMQLNIRRDRAKKIFEKIFRNPIDN